MTAPILRPEHAVQRFVLCWPCIEQARRYAGILGEPLPTPDDVGVRGECEFCSDHRLVFPVVILPVEVQR